eukprot:m.108474 g.108474  ORF g.108474 m.108474 type:complete len:440 (-) comp13348_c0_seq2:442-1761(-)
MHLAVPTTPSFSQLTHQHCAKAHQPDVSPCGASLWHTSPQRFRSSQLWQLPQQLPPPSMQSTANTIGVSVGGQGSAIQLSASQQIQEQQLAASLPALPLGPSSTSTSTSSSSTATLTMQPAGQPAASTHGQFQQQQQPQPPGSPRRRRSRKLSSRSGSPNPRMTSPYHQREPSSPYSVGGRRRAHSSSLATSMNGSRCSSPSTSTRQRCATNPEPRSLPDYAVQPSINNPYEDPTRPRRQVQNVLVPSVDDDLAQLFEAALGTFSANGSVPLRSRELPSSFWGSSRPTASPFATPQRSTSSQSRQMHPSYSAPLPPPTTMPDLTHDMNQVIPTVDISPSSLAAASLQHDDPFAALLASPPKTGHSMISSYPPTSSIGFTLPPHSADSTSQSSHSMQLPNVDSLFDGDVSELLDTELSLMNADINTAELFDELASQFTTV